MADYFDSKPIFPKGVGTSHLVAALQFLFIHPYKSEIQIRRK